jgi:hypothetical protein
MVEVIIPMIDLLWIVEKMLHYLNCRNTWSGSGQANVNGPGRGLRQTKRNSAFSTGE